MVLCQSKIKDDSGWHMCHPDLLPSLLATCRIRHQLSGAAEEVVTGIQLLSSPPRVTHSHHFRVLSTTTFMGRPGAMALLIFLLCLS